MVVVGRPIMCSVIQPLGDWTARGVQQDSFNGVDHRDLSSCPRQVCCLAVDPDRAVGWSMVRAQVTAWSERRSQAGASAAAVIIGCPSPGEAVMR